jgi:hypothetical protein
MRLLYGNPSLKHPMKLQISPQHHQLNLEKSHFEVLYTSLVFLSTQSLDLTIQPEVVVVEVKMHEIVPT